MKQNKGRVFVNDASRQDRLQHASILCGSRGIIHLTELHHHHLPARELIDRPGLSSPLTKPSILLESIKFHSQH